MGVVALVLIIILLLATVLVVGMAVSSAPRERDEEQAVGAEAPDTSDAQRRELEGIGTQLLERRVELDTRRGTLGGDTGLFDALDTLTGRYERGEIGEEQYEAEKVRLLGG